MKITIDTTSKTIKVEQAVNVKSLVHELRELLGDKMNEYQLMPTDIQWLNPAPIAVNPIWVIPTYPSYPTYPAAPFWGTTCAMGLSAPIAPLVTLNS